MFITVSSSDKGALKSLSCPADHFNKYQILIDKNETMLKNFKLK